MSALATRFGFVRLGDGRVGRTLRAEGETIAVALLDDPAAGVVELSVQADQVGPYELPRGAEVWVGEGPECKRIGTVRAFEGDGYLVRVGAKDERVGAEAITVWTGTEPFDPVGALGDGYLDSLGAYKARVGAIRNATHQRALYCGLTAAASASVELHRHQLDVVAQVTTDPVCRYVLADEVGMGKTIEAGLIIRQRLLDDPDAKVVISVPHPLVGQWEHELRAKLLLGGVFESRWKVVDHDDLSLAVLTSPSLLVIDEAHQLAERCLAEPVEAELAEVAAHGVEGVLLLTATPLRGNAEVFHYLLHLVDPVTYPRDDVDGFRERLRQRTEMAATIELLADEGMPWDYILDDLHKFALSMPNDKELKQLVATAIDGGESDRTLVASVSEHLRERYRLSRRVIRNQRSAAVDFPVLGRFFDGVVHFEDGCLELLGDLISRLRELAGDDQVLRQRFPEIIDGALAGPVALREVVEAISDLNAVTASECSNFLASAARLGMVDRIDAAVDFAAEWWSGGRGILLVASSSTAVARAVVEDLRRRVGEQSVRAHFASMERDDRDVSIDALTDHADPARILVMDRSGEEGRNLQFADVVLHVDVPVSVNRLEQRIGRVDRFGRGGARKKKRNVILRSSWAWEEARDRLHEATGVWDSSVATLQRPLAILEQKVEADLVTSGLEALTTLDLAALKSDLEDERHAVARLEELEKSAARIGLGDQQFLRLDRFEEEEWGSVREATIALTGGYGIPLYHYPVPQGQEAVFAYRRPNAEVAALLGRTSLDRLAAAWDRRRTFNRAIAVREPGTSPVRIGDPVFDELVGAVRRGQRSRARVALRSAPDVQGVQVWFQVDVLVEFSRTSDADPATRSRLLRVGDRLFPPVVVRRWSSGDAEPDADFVEKFLNTLPTGSADHPVGPQEWARVKELVPDLAVRAERARGRIIESLRSGTDFEKRTQEALVRLGEERRVGELAVGHFGSSERHVNRYLSELDGPVRQGIEEPQVETIAVGAYLLIGAPR